MSKKTLLKDLNPAQREAVLHTRGPILVLAGAGSGKTRVITHRFAYLTTCEKVSHNAVLAMTFTNKAAREMKERIEQLTGRSCNGLWIGTFHSLCARILRREIERLGYRPDFSIYDEDDSGALIRSILKEFRIHEALYKGILSKISSLKASLITPDALLAREDSYNFDEKFARVYVRYQDELKRHNALDFDDLIMLTIKVFEEDHSVLKRYQREFMHIMIDEFQDTNFSQYRLAKMLASRHKNICAVGDDDQSIYKFRGAEVKNIQTFQEDFPQVRIVKLEQNYRSTQIILNVADSVISRSPQRAPKKLWTDRSTGEKVCYCLATNEREEARYIAQTIKELYLKGRYTYKDMAVFYRINQQARVIEEALRDMGLPYRIFGGISFFQRKEIKDIVAYLKVIVNPDDSVSIKRIINTPPRQIGAATINRIENESKKREESLYRSMKHILKSNGYTSALKEKIRGFVQLIDELITHRDDPLDRLLEFIYEETGYAEWAGEEREENLHELVKFARGRDIRSFIDTASLYTGLDEECGDDCVTLMTLHSAKGLEFPVVFIAGVEDGLLPHFHAIKDEDELEEERRLFYVGITRAQDMLFMSCARRRRLYTSEQQQQPSRFLDDIPRQWCRCIEKRPRSDSAATSAVRSPVRTVRVSPFAAGTRVRHPKWGIGVVRDTYGDTEEDLKLMVNFPSVGLKKLSLKYANLERI